MSKLKTRQKTKKKSKLPDYTTLILKALKENLRGTYTTQQIWTALHIKEKSEKVRIKEALDQLLNNGTINKIGTSHYLYPCKSTYLVGRVDYVRSEYAYIIVPNQVKDILVFQKQLRSALDKDLVKVQLLPVGRRKRPEGMVVEILERNTTPMIGRIVASGIQPKAIVSQKRMSYNVFLQGESVSHLQVNDKVVIELTSYPSENNQLIGKVVQHLGQSGIHEVEMNAIMVEFGLKDTFPENILETIKHIPTIITKEEITRRRDLRTIPTFTIDPADAQDFDDALSYQELDNGLHQIGIHIADVSHYVLPDTLLDQEAYTRNTSVYLVDRCIPMLPELLSNQLCSLCPHEDKLTFSVLFEFDEVGKIDKKWFGETVIHSNKRFSYEEAQEIIDAKTGNFYPALTKLNNLARQLREERIKKGAINFETRELVFELDKHGKPLQVIPKVRKDTHKLIEEFMLLANKEVATYVATINLNQEKIRIHFCL